MKPKSVWGDVSRIIESLERSNISQDDRGARYQRQIDSDHSSTSVANSSQLALEGNNITEKDKSSKEVHFAFLPEKYEPLVEEDEAREQMKEEKRLKKKQKYKKYRKNVGKALRLGWKCLLVGLQSFTAGYSTPLAAAANFVPDLNMARSRG